MFILISQRDVPAEKGANRDALEQDYVSYYEKFGITLIPVSNNSKNIEEYFKLPIHGIILSGGNNVNPKLYNQEAKYPSDFSINRDNIEKKLLELAIHKKLPVLCECRGSQFLNVFFGGSLIQNLKEELNTNHIAVTHIIKITYKEVSSFLGKTETKVNSFHKQGFTKKELSKKLKVFAIAEDGVIEGIYHPDYPIAGILWHPERDNSDKELDEKLIKVFVEGTLFWKK
ncbi:gamma-glutamyl-gamma-aminobutyrate hydrolase family protein [Candidatus Woesearchaeota archaeon]|nr:gamma-glutamyl-gamma-aminobutyrate hydrolase family protein [Candidatus Woesearchaeota archaeon]